MVVFYIMYVGTSGRGPCCAWTQRKHSQHRSLVSTHRVETVSSCSSRRKNPEAKRARSPREPRGRESPSPETEPLCTATGEKHAASVGCITFDNNDT
jgi:hypothetical protein